MPLAMSQIQAVGKFRDKRSFDSCNSKTSAASFPSLPSHVSGCSYATNEDEHDEKTAGLDHPTELAKRLKRQKITDAPTEEAKASTDGVDIKALDNMWAPQNPGNRPPGNFSQCNVGMTRQCEVSSSSFQRPAIQSLTGCTIPTPCTGNSQFAQVTRRHSVQIEERRERPGTADQKEKRVKKRKESRSNLEQSEVFRGLQDVGLFCYTYRDHAAKPLSKDVIFQESERRAKWTISDEDSRAIVVKDKNEHQLGIRTRNGHFDELDDR